MEIYYTLYGALLLLVPMILSSFRLIGPTEVGLVVKRFSFRRLKNDNAIAFRGEAGYQAKLLMPGLHFKLSIFYRVEKHPWVQIPADKIGVVVSQIGNPLPTGAKSGVYKEVFGDFSDITTFVENGGEKGVQRPVLPPGTLAPIHPIAFLVITENRVYGKPVSTNQVMDMGGKGKKLTAESFGLRPEQLRVIRIEPQAKAEGGDYVDTIGIVTTYEGNPLPSGAIASRINDFNDIEEMELEGAANDRQLIEAILASKNAKHNSYQDFQAFMDHGGSIGLQHDPLLYGAYLLNPFLLKVKTVPMLVVKQGEVAVIKSYVGLVTQDTSGHEFKFGSLVRPGHRGIWQEPLRTGKYPINPHCYKAEIVPTAILTLNWAEATSQAHNLDQQLKSIVAKSCEGFEFAIDLQVQIHVADTQAPWVISMVGTMQNMVHEVLQAAVGNHFRDKLQSMPAINFIETRHQVQKEALNHIQEQLRLYKVETPGVYIQDVILPAELVKVLTDKEIANQEIETFKKQEESQIQRVNMEKAKGTANMQSELAQSQVNVEIFTNKSKARKEEAEGEAQFIEKTGKAQGAKVHAVGMARADAYTAQVNALGQLPTALVNVVTALSEGSNKFVPDVQVGGQSGTLDGLMGLLTKQFIDGGNGAQALQQLLPKQPLSETGLQAMEKLLPKESALKDELVTEPIKKTKTVAPIAKPKERTPINKEEAVTVKPLQKSPTNLPHPVQKGEPTQQNTLQQSVKGEIPKSRSSFIEDANLNPFEQ